MSKLITGQYVIERVTFGSLAQPDDHVVRAEGTLKLATAHVFQLTASPAASGEWTLREFRATPRLNVQIDPTDPQSFIRVILNHVARTLKTTNLWAGTQQGSAANIVLNQIKAPEDAAPTLFASFRIDALGLPDSRWEKLWDQIEARVEHDPYFGVHGFTQEEVREAMAPLQQAFPASWVKARYRQHDGPQRLLGADFQPDTEVDWFPAYHLARTALGAICVDPGWNYLLEIGLSVRELRDFPDARRLVDRLAQSPGTQHHLCLAAELFRRGYLIGLEPPTGAGSATNDLLVSINNRRYAIEVKEFSGRDPVRSLERELSRKHQKAPKNLAEPIVFHAVLIEDGTPNLPKERQFADDVAALTSVPDSVSAMVIGRRFVDAAGGRVKRDVIRTVINPRARLTPALEDLELLFARNYEECLYPIHGLGTFFYFSNTPQPTDAAGDSGPNPA